MLRAIALSPEETFPRRAWIGRITESPRTILGASRRAAEVGW